jgi:hypothetical protein
MATEAQTSANRLNAQKSTGPRTAEGKAAVALNAVKHGLRAQAVVLPGEEPDEYEQYRRRILEDLQPQDFQEMERAERIVGLAWQLRRAGRYHSAVFDALYEQQAAQMAAQEGETGPGDRVLGRMLVADFSGPRVLERVQLYERRIERSLLRARAEWDGLREERRKEGEKVRMSAEQTISPSYVPTFLSPPAPGGVTTNPSAGGKDVGGTNKPNVTRPAAGPKPAMNEQSQWQFPELGGLGLGRTNKADFGGPIDVLAILAAHKRLPARRAM